MARAKKTEAPKVDIGGEIFSSLRELEKLNTMKQQLKTLRKTRDKALNEGDVDVFKKASKEIDRLDKKVKKQETLVRGLNHTMESLSTAKQKELNALIGAINQKLNSGAVERNSKEWKVLNDKLKEVKKELRNVR